MADVDAAADRLQAADVAVGETQRESWGWLVEVVDPDGCEIGLYAPPSRFVPGPTSS